MVMKTHIEDVSLSHKTIDLDNNVDVEKFLINVHRLTFFTVMWHPLSNTQLSKIKSPIFRTTSTPF